VSVGKFYLLLNNMSRIGKQTINIPKGVTVKQSDGNFAVNGPKGNLERRFKNDIEMIIKDDTITLHPKKDTIFTRALWGTYASHIVNMIEGVTDGYEKKLIIEGVGYKAELQNPNLILTVGFSHPVKMLIPEGITVTVEKNKITMKGNDKEKIGLFASKIRLVKKPEPYKGKGIRYEGEIVRRKQGKKAV